MIVVTEDNQVYEVGKCIQSRADFVCFWNVEKTHIIKIYKTTDDTFKNDLYKRIDLVKKMPMDHLFNSKIALINNGVVGYVRAYDNRAISIKDIVGMKRVELSLDIGLQLIDFFKKANDKDLFMEQFSFFSMVVDRNGRLIYQDIEDIYTGSSINWPKSDGDAMTLELLEGDWFVANETSNLDFLKVALESLYMDKSQSDKVPYDQLISEIAASLREVNDGSRHYYFDRLPWLIKKIKAQLTKCPHCHQMVRYDHVENQACNHCDKEVEIHQLPRIAIEQQFCLSNKKSAVESWISAEYLVVPLKEEMTRIGLPLITSTYGDVLKGLRIQQTDRGIIFCIDHTDLRIKKFNGDAKIYTQADGWIVAKKTEPLICWLEPLSQVKSRSLLHWSY